MAQFRQFGNQGRRGDATDAGNVLQQLGHDGAVPLNVTEHFSVDILKLIGDGFEQPLDVRARDRASQAQALTLRESQDYELASPGDQSHQILLCWIAQRVHEALAVGTLSQCGSELGEGSGVNAVGLSQSLHRTCEVTSHARVDYRHAQPG